MSALASVPPGEAIPFCPRRVFAAEQGIIFSGIQFYIEMCKKHSMKFSASTNLTNRLLVYLIYILRSSLDPTTLRQIPLLSFAVNPAVNVPFIQ